MLADTITPLSDARPAPVPAPQSFPGSSAGEWAGLACSGLDAQGAFSPNLGLFLVRWGDRLVLCDAGIGPGPNAYLGGLEGRLPQALAEIGVAPEAIDLVIYTHLHMDHLGWATRADASGARVQTFANARHVVARGELAYWSSNPADARPHHREAFDQIFRPLIGLGVVTAIAHGEPILPGVSLISTPGHTPDHAAIRFDGAGETLVVAGDICHAPGQVERPDWAHRADMDPEAARVTRRRFIAEAAAHNWLLAFGHFRDGLQLGRIATSDTGFIYRPAS